MRSNIFDRLSFWSLFLVITLLPLFFLPFSNIPVETSKSLLLVVGLVTSLIFWGFARFFDGKIIFPKSYVLLSGAGIAVVFLISSLLSEARGVSLFGTILDTGSFWFIFAGMLLMFMSSIIFRNSKNAKILLFGMLLSGSLVLLFQIVHTFVPEILSLGVLAGKTGNLFGSWNALGIFSGLILLISLIMVEFLSSSAKEKMIFSGIMVLSVIMAAAVNFPLVWMIIGVFSALIFIYKASLVTKKSKAEGLSGEETIRRPDFPVFSFAILLVSLILFISSGFVGQFLPNKLGVQNTEISPSFSSTFETTKSVVKSDPVLGIGPNKFGTAFAMHKPQAINNTAFWDTFFTSGSGLIPSVVSTTGILGLLAWLIFFVLFIYSGVKVIFSRTEKIVDWGKMAFFFLALYLFVSSFFYSTGPVIFLLALSFAGVFLGLTASSQENKEVNISFLNDHRKSFFSMLFLVLLIIVSVVATFTYSERLVALSYFGKAVTAATIPEAEANISKTLSLYQNDLYLRTYSQVYIVKLNSLASRSDEAGEEQKAELQSTLDQAVSGAQLATVYDSKNYLNYQMLGSVYQTAASLGVKDGYSKAAEQYMIASSLNPNNPGLKLGVATVLFLDNKNAEARDYANLALTLKPDYVDALLVLSQISKKEGDNASALTFAERALSISPGDENLKQYVDSLKSGTSSTAAGTQQNTNNSSEEN